MQPISAAGPRSAACRVPGKPDPKLPADKQDKRMVVMIDPGLWDAWLEAPVSHVQGMITPAPAEYFEGLPDPERLAR